MRKPGLCTRLSSKHWFWWLLLSLWAWKHLFNCWSRLTNHKIWTPPLKKDQHKLRDSLQETINNTEKTAAPFMLQNKEDKWAIRKLRVKSNRAVHLFIPSASSDLHTANIQQAPQHFPLLHSQKRVWEHAGRRHSKRKLTPKLKWALR